MQHSAAAHRYVLRCLTRQFSLMKQSLLGIRRYHVSQLVPVNGLEDGMHMQICPDLARLTRRWKDQEFGTTAPEPATGGTDGEIEGDTDDGAAAPLSSQGEHFICHTASCTLPMPLATRYGKKQPSTDARFSLIRSMTPSNKTSHIQHQSMLRAEKRVATHGAWLHAHECMSTS
jgi:hypothetical protein